MARLLLFASLLAFAGCHRWDDDDGWGWTYDPADVTADGEAEILVGSPGEDAGGTARGVVRVYRGPDRSFLGTLTGLEDGARFGEVVVTIGDVDGDGRPDLAVGAPYDDADGNSTDDGLDRGRVFIYFGGRPFPDGSLVLSGTENGGRFGASVARAGDVNRDGYEDVLVGAPFEDAGGSDRGRAYLFLGGHSMSSSPELGFSGVEDGSRFGASTSTAGDYDRDGFTDWMIGAPREDAGGSDRGRVRVYRGAHDPGAWVDLVLDGQEDNAEFGASIAGVLDVDDDAYDDLLVGAPFDDDDGSSATAGTPRGRAYFFSGYDVRNDSSVGAFSATLVLHGAEDDSSFGAHVARVGDVNDGGAPDFFVGAPLEDAGGTDRGRGYLYFGGPSVNATADVVFTGGEDGAFLGTWAASGGDVDDDGRRDLVIGAPGDDADGNSTEDGLDRGRAYFHRGRSSIDNVPETIFDGPQDGAGFGTSLD